MLSVFLCQGGGYGCTYYVSLGGEGFKSQILVLQIEWNGPDRMDPGLRLYLGGWMSWSGNRVERL